MSRLQLNKIINLKLFQQSRRLLWLSSERWKGKLNVSECKPPKETHCIFDMCSIRPGTPQPCVVIIGAGMAGLSAANRLVQCGITNFRILEAMDSPGGRVRTCWIGDTVVEAGWGHIEGACLANPLFTLAAQELLLPPPIQWVNEDTALVLTSDGRAVESRLLDRAKSLFDQIELAAEEKADTQYASLGERMRVAIDQKLKEHPKHDRWDLARALYGLLGVLKSKIGQSLNELSPEALGDRSPLPGGSVAVKGGMTALLAPLVRTLPAGALQTCKPVHTVLWGTAGPGAPRAVVRTCDGENFPADYVIVTVPLGLLKTSADKMFCPQLPAYKMEAVRSLGFGTVNKVFLKYENPFWADEGGTILLAWTPKEYETERSWIRGVSAIEMVPGSKKVLSLTVSGPEALQMESMTDEAVAADCGALLQRFLGAAMMPPPSEILRSRWAVSPYAGGSKTFLGTGSGRGMVSSLAAPLPTECDQVPPILLFAGEHTHPDYLGTLHGSRLSGIREADRVVKLTKRFNGPPDKGPVCIPCS